MEYKNAYLQIVEETYLSKFAQHVKDTKGRLTPIPPCPLRTEYQRDRDRIIHSKAFRRLKHKTQVFLSPEGDHYRTRLTHTLEVAQIARTMARALRLNEDLTEAMCLGHDLGHTPFGHAGEAVLNKLIKGGFIHSQHSLRVVDLLEGDGKGLNLTYEVRDGKLYTTKLIEDKAIHKTVYIKAINASSGNSYEKKFDLQLYTSGSGIDEVLAEGVKLYPVPADDVLTLETPEAEGRYVIYSVAGTQLLRGQVSDTLTTIDVSGLSRGSYMLQYSTAQGVVNKAFIVK